MLVHWKPLDTRFRRRRFPVRYVPGAGHGHDTSPAEESRQLPFSFYGGFGGLESDFTVSAVTEGLVHGTSAAAERECGFAGKVVLLASWSLRLR